MAVKNFVDIKGTQAMKKYPDRRTKKVKIVKKSAKKQTYGS